MVDGHVSMIESFKRDLAASGYTVVEQADDATYIVQLNHLKLVAVELESSQTIEDAFGMAMVSGWITGIAADIISSTDDWEVAAAVAIVAGVAAFIIDSSTKHMAYLLTTDVLITEAVPALGSEVELRYHETRIVSGASKVNLGLEESLPAITTGTSSSLAGLLPKQSA